MTHSLHEECRLGLPHINSAHSGASSACSTNEYGLRAPLRALNG
ncbi:hypothetical protein [Streptomyces sp. TLI_55]|nr:hypothetical protein [Streptomyces sp. TLI_55]